MYTHSYKNFIVPPDIITEDSSADVAVQEGEDATLTCRATGNPTPRVMWKREDGDSILMRKAGSREMQRGERLLSLFFENCFSLSRQCWCRHTKKSFKKVLENVLVITQCIKNGMEYIKF